MRQFQVFLAGQPYDDSRWPSVFLTVVGLNLNGRESSQTRKPTGLVQFLISWFCTWSVPIPFCGHPPIDLSTKAPDLKVETLPSNRPRHAHVDASNVGSQQTSVSPYP